MSFFEGFVQGASDAASGILDRQIQNDEMLTRQKALADYAEQMEERKQEAKRKLQAELGTKINSMADEANRQRIADKINMDNGSSMTAEDAADIAKNPNALKAYGIIDRTRAQELDDKANAADKLGATDQAKMIRDQQNVEIQRDNNERRLKADEKRNEIAQAQLDAKERMSGNMLDQREAESQRRHDEAMAKIDALLTKNGGDSKGAMQYLTEVRKKITADKTDIRKRIETEKKWLFSEEDKKAVDEKHAPALKILDDEERQLTKDFNKKREELGFDPIGGSTPSTKPTANAPAKTSTQPADSDQINILKGEFNKASGLIASARTKEEKHRYEQDLIAVKNELKRLGVDVENQGRQPEKTGQSTGGSVPSVDRQKLFKVIRN